ncbi:MAG: type III toxin-antitoxin system ToxN/AbiQ family toxin, partial [Campylobacterales bacterium]
NVSSEAYLIYEMIDISELSDKDIYVCLQENNGRVKKILSILDIKKMIPVKNGVYEKLDMDSIKTQDSKYFDLLLKEYRFLTNKKAGIINKANKIYTEQIRSGNVKKFHCNFKQLEEACKNYDIL